MGLMDKIFGTHSQHELKRIYPIVDRIEALEPEMKALSDAELKDTTREFKERLKEGETLDFIRQSFIRTYSVWKVPLPVR